MMADDPTWEFPLASEKRSNLHILPTAAARPPETLPYFTFEETEANLDCADFVEGVLTDGAMSVIYGESNTGL